MMEKIVMQKPQKKIAPCEMNSFNQLQIIFV